MVQVMNAFVKQILPSAIVRDLTDAEKAAYAAPYPTMASRKPTLVWPREIPIDGQPADVHEIVSSYHDWLCETQVPKLLLWAKPGGLVTGGTVRHCEQRFPNMQTVQLDTGIHFLQEDDPHGIGRAIAAWLPDLPA